MSAHDGGPAFPVAFSNDTDHNVTVPGGTVPPGGTLVVPGMSLRDYFAAKALQGLLANPERYRYITHLVASAQHTQEEASDKNARKAYLIADAMLKARLS